MWGNSGKRVKRWWYYMSARRWRLSTGRSSDFLREILYLNFYVKCSNLYISWLKLKEKTKLWAKTWILQNNRLKCLSWHLNAFSSSLEFFADHLPAWANCLALSGWGKVLQEMLRIIFCDHWAAVDGVAQSWTRLKRLSSSSSSNFFISRRSCPHSWRDLV